METSTAKRDVYDIVNEKIIQCLERGTVPWKQPWHDAGMPQNLVTKRPYRGVNLMLLASRGYTINCFLTSKQLKEIGGSIKPDQKPHLVVYWKWLEASEEERRMDSKKKPFLRYYTVFNVAQCEGIPASLLPDTKRIANPIPACQYIVDAMPDKPTVQHAEPKAYYDPARDLVNMPRAETFATDDGYYATLFHELVHSTGHKKRLNRKGIQEMSEFGSDAYSFEELVAETGAAYLCSFTGISEERLEQNAAYIQGWLKKLKSDRKFVVLAAAQAQKATDFVLNVCYQE